MVEREVKAVYGASHVAAVNVVYDTTQVEPLLAKYDAQKLTLTDITDDYVGKLKRRKTIKKRKQVCIEFACRMGYKWQTNKAKSCHMRTVLCCWLAGMVRSSYMAVIWRNSVSATTCRNLVGRCYARCD
jgi:hypothetical protein